MTWTRPKPRFKVYDGDRPDAPREPVPRAAPSLSVVQPIPKREYRRDESYRRFVASLPCAHCGIEGRSQAAHSDAGADGKGKGIKADDDTCFPLCADAPSRRGCHSLFGASGKFTRELQQALAKTYGRATRIKAFDSGHWPAHWPGHRNTP